MISDFVVYNNYPLSALLLILLVALRAIIAFGILREAYSRWRGCHGMGLGDVKFFGAAATWVGFQGLPTLVLIASISGLAFAIIRSLVGLEACRETRIAFGPHLSIGLAFICIFGSIE